jgi:hypothetical protein
LQTKRYSFLKPTFLTKQMSPQFLLRSLFYYIFFVSTIYASNPISTSLDRSMLFPSQTKGPSIFPLAGCGAITFSVPVFLGNNGDKPLNLLVDTGSSTLAAASVFCDSSCSHLSPLYRPSDFATNQGSTNAAYQGGDKWTGISFLDMMQIGSVRARANDSMGENELTESQISLRFAAIQTSNQFFAKYNCYLEGATNEFQGILGLAFGGLAAPNTDAPLTALNLGEFTIQLCEAGGNLWLERFDPSFLTAPFHYTPIVHDLYYAVNVVGLSIGGVETVNRLVGSISALVDSGSTNLILPLDMFNAFVNTIYDSVAFQQAFESYRSFFNNNECLTTSWTRAELNAALPTWSITFAESTGEFKGIEAVDSYLISYYYDQGEWVYCPGVSVSCAAAAIGGSEIITLGYAALNHFTTRFDIIENKIGFAWTARCGEAAEPFPFWSAVTSDATECNFNSVGNCVQQAINVTCMFPNLTATNNPELCANQSQIVQRFCTTCSTDDGFGWVFIVGVVLGAVLAIAICGLILTVLIHRICAKLCIKEAPEDAKVSVPQEIQI